MNRSTRQQQNMFCQQEDHLKFHCVGFCFNRECQFKGQKGCELCLARVHLPHYQDFLYFDEISRRLHGTTGRKGIEQKLQEVERVFTYYREQIVSKLNQFQSHLVGVLNQFFPLIDSEDFLQKDSLTTSEIDKILQEVNRPRFVQELKDVEQIFEIYQNQIKHVLKGLSSFYKEGVAITKARSILPEDFSSDKPFIQSYFHKMKKFINIPSEILVIRGIPLEKPIIFKNGDQYDGEVLSHKMHGHGTLIEKDGSMYTGVFNRGNLVYGASFKWVDTDESNPYAVMSLGYMVNKLVEGHGCQYFSDNSKYIGQLEKGLKQGMGKYFQPIQLIENDHDKVKQEDSMDTQFDGTVYHGDWSNDLQHGRGVLLYPDGSKFEGHFKEGKKEGFGIVHLPIGRRLEGMYVGDFRDGEHKVLTQDGILLQTKFYVHGHDINRTNHKKVKTEQEPQITQIN